MQKIGITGGIATGKSTVGRILSGLGLTVCDCDDLVARLYQSEEIKDILQSRFGWEVFLPDGRIDQKKLSQYAFTHPEILSWLQSIIWPRLRRELELWFFAQEKKHAPVVFVLGTHVFSSGMSDLFDEIWQIVSTHEQALQRLQARDRIKRTVAQSRWQLARDQKLKPSQIKLIISNKNNLDALHQEVATIITARGWL